jgi:predicted GIY-YIG superfamily endonuclease
MKKRQGQTLSPLVYVYFSLVLSLLLSSSSTTTISLSFRRLMVSLAVLSSIVPSWTSSYIIIRRPGHQRSIMSSICARFRIDSSNLSTIGRMRNKRNRNCSRRKLNPSEKSMSSNHNAHEHGPVFSLLSIPTKRKYHSTTVISWRQSLRNIMTCQLQEEDADDYEFISLHDTTQNNNNNNNDERISPLDLLYDEIKRLNDGQDLNVNSPKQVSTAIFGSPRTATKRVLQQVVSNALSEDDGDPLPHEKQRLAQIILEYKQLVHERRKSEGDDKAVISESEHTDAILSSAESMTDSRSSTQQSTDRSQDSVARKRKLRPRESQPERQFSHEQAVEQLFATPNSKIDDYWKGPLLQLSRPTARELLAQLNPQQCPMGFDPDATPNNRRGGAGGGQQQQMQQPTTTLTTSTMGRKGTFLSFCRTQKEMYPQCVILVRCGDFYETYGLDAILLVEHVGLNPMAGKVKAGCPWRNIQATVDGLTQQGFSVAVYEEVSQVQTTNTKSSNKLKTRVLTQIVTPASPTYLYDNWLLAGGGATAGGDDASSSNGAFDHLSLHGLPPSRPCVGVVRTAAGYNMIEVSLEERSIQYSERLTQEAVACRLAAYPPADPLIYVPSPNEEERARSGSKSGTVVPSFLPKTRSSGTMKSLSGDTTNASDIVDATLGGYRLRVKLLSPKFLPGQQGGQPEADGYIRAVVDTLVQLNERQPEDDDMEDNRLSSTNHFHATKRTTVDDFSVTMTDASTNALYLETARQVGLLPDTTAIPSLIHHALDDAAPVSTRRFLQRYLLVPPPPKVARGMSEVVGALIDPECVSSLPPLTVPNLGKVLSLIRAGQAGSNVYAELLQSLATTLYVLEENSVSDAFGGSGSHRLPVQALLHITQHESGLVADLDSMKERCQSAIDAIESVLSTSYHVAESTESDDRLSEVDDVVSTDQHIPPAFFGRNEATWRGRVQPSVASSAYERVQKAAKKLCDAVGRDFIAGRDANKSLIIQDVFNNIIALKQKPETLRSDCEYFHPRDRNGKVLKNRWTTAEVQDALSEYVKACEVATDEVSSILSSLAQKLQDEGHIPALVQSGHFNIILSMAFHHASKAMKSKWQLARTIEYETEACNDENTSAQFANVFPYWMYKSQAVSNTFDLQGMVLLTAPNMSGKSTLMRSTAAAALLTVCGLCAPLSSESRIPRFDTLFVRGASSDVPTEDKSAFGAEMEDVAALFRCCGPRSLVFVDELGRGTSPTDGTRLAGAVLEAMAERGMVGVFATHLHDVVDLPLRGKGRIETKRMAIVSEDEDGENYRWTYKVEDGVCTDSLALVTAKRFGLPLEIIQRAEELQGFLPDRMSSMNGPDDEVNGSVADELDDDAPSSYSLPSKSRPRADGERLRHFNKAIAMVTQLTGKSPISIPPRWSPPASISNKSCLYMLELAEDPPRYYVGETDSLSQRLRQHRMKGGRKWSQCRAFALPVDNKSQARAFESLLIRELARSGFSMESLTDGRSIRRYRDESS